MVRRDVLQARWLVTPREAPRVWRYCNRCEDRSPFYCSDKFRTNLQKKRVDVWLIYRCQRCDQTWNYPIHERRALKDIAPDELTGFAQNHPAMTRRFAFDVARLRRFAERIEVSSDTIVQKSVRAKTDPEPRALEILLRVPFGSTIRADRFLAKELGISRTTVCHLHDSGSLVILPGRRSVLRKAICDGQTISIDLHRLHGAADRVTTISKRAFSL